MLSKRDYNFKESFLTSELWDTLDHKESLHQENLKYS